MKLIGKIFKILGIITLVIFVLTIANVIFIPSEPEQKYSNITALYSTTNLNIRKGSSGDHDVLKTVKTNTRLLTFDSISNGFMMILNHDSTKLGWASTRYLQNTPIKIEKQEQEEYSITITNSSFDENSVDYEIETNIPLPVEVMLSIGLVNLKPEESAIGSSERIRITQSPLVYRLAISDAQLPSGTYEAKVTFYSNWGAKNGNNDAKKIKTDVTGKNQIELQTSFGTAEERKAKDKKQRWVIENVIIGTPWDLKKFTEELGEYEELKVTNRNSEIIKVYYFNEADMTIFVNKLKNNVATWRMGETNTL